MKEEAKPEAKPAAQGDGVSSQESFSHGSSSHGSSSHRNSSQGASFPELVPIAALVPGIERELPNWEIRGLVVCRSNVETYNNGNGKYFSFEMKDKAGGEIPGEIRVVCFDSQVDRFFHKVIEGKEHFLSRGKLKTPKPKYNPQNRKCEIVLEYHSFIQAIEVEENKTLLERVTELEKAVEFCKSKLQELETEIKTGKAKASCNIL